MKSYLKPGAWNAVCMVCGFNHKSTELRRRWDGLMVCEDDFEIRNPQDFIHMPPEYAIPDWTSPSQDTFLTYDLATQAGDHLITQDVNNLTW